MNENLKIMAENNGWDVEILTGSNPDVWKFIFKTDKKIVEAVLYRYGDFKTRTVLCVSVQSGCPVGCTFCGTGANFLSSLSYKEIIFQVELVMQFVWEKGVADKEIEKFQIMYMSMGEPMLNWQEVESAINYLGGKYPKAQQLISTIGVHHAGAMNSIIDLAARNKNIGLQFSIHESSDEARNLIIPFKRKLSLQALSMWGKMFFLATGRKVFLNYVSTFTNTSMQDVKNLKELFSPEHFAFTFSVLCKLDSTIKNVTDPMEVITAGVAFSLNQRPREFVKHFPEYDTRVFDPAGQDDIGGGCGQLWKVQEFLRGN